MQDLAIILAMPVEDTDDLSKCRDYPTMQSYQISKHTKSHPKVTLVGTPYGWLSLNELDKAQKLIDVCREQSVNLSDHKNLLLCGVNTLKRFDKKSIDQMRSVVKGNLYQIDDSNFNEGKDFVTLAHYIKKSKPSEYSIDLGLAVADDVFEPGPKNLSGTFVVHVDHRWTKTQRLDGFDEVRTLLKNIKEYVSSDERWNDLRVIYHTEEISDIDSIGTYDPKDTDILSLAKIYSGCHLALVSHAETLGQYPLEMLCSGTSVVMNRKFIPKETRQSYHFYEFETFDFRKFMRDLNEETAQPNRASVSNFGYEIWVEKMLDSIIK